MADIAEFQQVLARYPTLSAALGPAWLGRNVHPDVPLWRYDMHPLITALTLSNADDLIVWDSALATLERVSIKRLPSKNKMLRDPLQFGALRPEIMLAALLLDNGYGVEFPNAEGARAPDLRVISDGQAAGIEVKAVAPSPCVTSLMVRLHHLMDEHPDYTVYLGIPDDAAISRADVTATCDGVASFLATDPIKLHGSVGRHSLPLGDSDYNLMVVWPSEGARTINHFGISYGFGDILIAARKINKYRLVKHSEQLRDGGAFLLDMTSALPAAQALVTYYDPNPEIGVVLWNGVPSHVYGIWCAHFEAGRREPRAVRFLPNPHTASTNPIVEKLCADALQNRNYPPASGD